MKDLLQIIDQARVKFKEIPMEAWSHKPSPGKWSKKEILGHLIDSARNNLQRFTEIQYQKTPYLVIPYDQDQSVLANVYQQQSLEIIEKLWLSLNHHIWYIMQGQSKSSLELEVITPEGTRTNLKWLMDDYIEHLEHHLKQIIQ